MPGAGIVLQGVGLPAAMWPHIPVVIISETLTLMFCVFVPVMPSFFLTDDRSCHTNWDTLESKMDAINNCAWTIDLNLNGPERNEEALFQTCVSKTESF